MKIRQKIVFEGSVQGVGFRYRAQYAAHLYGCTGRAVNYWDGTVHMEIRGEPEAIDAVIAAVERGRFVRIDSMEVERIPVVEGEERFATR